uniref:Fungal lipase-like domain-containing protein n=1 Tax=Daucus carota subsp. sativus TaxID=79200 RepID=A0A175YPJ6_DAUCS
MAASTMATAAGMVVILYYVSRKLLSTKVDDDDDNRDENSKSSRSVKRRIARRPAHAPATWLETINTLTETLRFTYAETLGKWPIGDLAFGINYYMRRQGNLQVASVYAGDDCVQLKGPDIIADMKHYLSLLTCCILFSKKPFPVFLESAGYTHEDVILREPKAGILRPAFTILCDKNLKCFLLVIRGTHSIKDTLTAATGAVVPFHHSVLHDGGISDLVLGYAHCGMVAAARWIAKLSCPFLLKALNSFPDYQVKIVGHSLGGGTASLLTYILREQKEFSSTTCITFAPAACMTWELAESGKHFITTIINGSDLVPTFSTASIDDLRSEVTASSWYNDLLDQVEHTRVLNVFYRSATALGSRLPTMASARERVASASALLRPVSNSTQASSLVQLYGVMRRAQNVAEAVVRSRSTLASWSCMGARRRTVASLPSPKEEDSPETSLLGERSSSRSLHPFKSETANRVPDANRVKGSTSRGVLGHDETDEEEEVLTDTRVSSSASNMGDMSEGEFLYELEMELQRGDNGAEQKVQQKAGITKEEIELAVETDTKPITSTSDVVENLHLYPPGRIMHIITVVTSEASDSGQDHITEEHEHKHVSIYETNRELYSKLRLSKTMVNDHYMPMYKKMIELLIKELEK